MFFKNVDKRNSRFENLGFPQMENGAKKTKSVKYFKSALKTLYGVENMSY